jgi:sugar lactone lactonase YvrE
VDTNGIITTVAGNGAAGYSGDGGAATNARLHLPYSVTVDAVGNMFIADTTNNRVREVPSAGYPTLTLTNVSATNAGSYTVVVTSPYGSVTSTVATLTLAALPSIVVQPASQVVAADSNVAFSVTAAGSLPLCYSWFFDATNLLQSGTNSPLSLNNAGSGDAGSYTVVVTNAWGRVTSAVATLTVQAPPDITGQPVSQIAFAGSNSVFSVGVAGSEPFGYLWYLDSTNLLQSNSINTLTLPAPSATNAGSYTVVITNLYGSVTSAVAILTVEAPPVITGQPVSQIVFGGSNSLFSVGVAGSGPFGYLWYLDDTKLLQSNSINTLLLRALSATNAGSYTVVVTNAWGSVTSQIATLMVVFPPSVTTPPGNRTVLAGTTASLGVTVAGTGPLSYQWQFNGSNLPYGIITTVAGNGATAYAGDGGAATNASLAGPSDIAFDAVGDLFISDTAHNRVRKVDTNGIITTVAGNGQGYPILIEPVVDAGDGGPATNALVNSPVGLNLDALGNLYIADFYNFRIRRVATNGIITTFAGAGLGGAGDGGPATNASLSLPTGVALDSTGNLYIADRNHARIRKVDTNGIISTVAGNGAATYAGDGGPATNTSLCGPTGVAFDAFGNLYIADLGNNRIRKVDTNGIISTVAGIGPGATSGSYSGDGGAATNAGLYYPADVALDAIGNLYIADGGNNRVRRVDANGMITTVAGIGPSGTDGRYSGDGAAATNASLFDPSGVALDAVGNLYIADTHNERIRKVLLYAGYPTLTLSSVSATNGGSYTVVVTSPYGSATSAVTTLNVALAAPQIMTSDASFGFVTSQFGFNLSGDSGQTIVVDGSPDLVNWTPLFTNTVAGGAVYFCDPCWTNFSWRFYRARLP